MDQSDLEQTILSRSFERTWKIIFFLNEQFYRMNFWKKDRFY